MRRPRAKRAALLTVHALLRDARTGGLLLLTESCATSTAQDFLECWSWQTGAPLEPEDLQALLRGAVAGLTDLAAMARSRARGPHAPPR